MSSTPYLRDAHLGAAHATTSKKNYICTPRFNTHTGHKQLKMKGITILLVVLFCVAQGCQNERCTCEISSETLVKNDSIYNLVLNNPEKYYENYWKGFDEPFLSHHDKESYRLSIKFLVYDYFKIYRVERDQNEYKLTIKEYAVSTTTRSRADSLVTHYTRSITKSDWLKISKAFEENCFWTMPIDLESEYRYLDGSSWTLEALKQNNNCKMPKYHTVSRFSPDSSAFVTICREFMNLDSINLRRF